MKRDAAATAMDRISVIHLTWKRYVQQQLARFGVTPKQFFLLRRLRDAEFLSPSEVARLLFCDRPTATVVIRNLEKLGWVRRRTDPGNRRQRQISITPRGEALLNGVPDDCFRTTSTAMDPFGALSADELRLLNQLLRRVQERLREQRDDRALESAEKRRTK